MTTHTTDKQVIIEAKTKFENKQPYMTKSLAKYLGTTTNNESLLTTDQSCSHILQKLQSGLDLQSNTLNVNKHLESRPIIGYQQFDHYHSLDYPECVMDLRFYCQGVVLFVGYKPKKCYGFVGLDSESQIQLYLTNGIGDEDIQLTCIDMTLRRKLFTKQISWTNSFGKLSQTFWIGLADWADINKWLEEKLDRTEEEDQA